MTDHPHPIDRPSPQLRAEALEALLVERGLVKPEALDGFINRYVNDVGPMNGARVVAKAWVDPEYRQRLIASAAPKVSTSWSSKTRRRYTTWSYAPFARATRGRSSVFRLPGTKIRPIALG
jgi:hypothetical protein